MMQKTMTMLAVGVLGWGAAAGPIDPPFGPVGPTMKALDVVEPRTPISAATTPGDSDSLFRISQPGSYYLTADLVGVVGKHGIEIAASDVTIDLMGFTMTGVSGSLDGVNCALAANVAVRNGAVQGWAGDGLDLRAAANSSADRVRVGGSGFAGVATGERAVVTSCVVTASGRNGIEVKDGSVITDCVVQANQTGILTFGDTTISRCSVTLNTGTGISAADSNTIFGCTINRNGAHGIVLTNGYVYGCNVSENVGNGIDVTSDCSIVDNHCVSNGQAGINARNRRNRIERNYATDNLVGIKTNDWHNFVASNIALANGTEFSLSDGGLAGKIILHTGTIDDNSAWANLGF